MHLNFTGLHVKAECLILSIKQCLGFVSASHNEVITVLPGCKKCTPVSPHS